MAINPISGSSSSQAADLLSAAAPKSRTSQPAQAAPPSVAQLQVLEPESGDPLLDALTGSPSDTQQANSDPLLGDGAASTSTSSLGTFDSMTGGDPLLDDLNSQDNQTLLSDSSSEDTLLNQGLTSFLLQQASSTYCASQLMGHGTGSSTGTLGQTTA